MGGPSSLRLTKAFWYFSHPNGYQCNMPSLFKRKANTVFMSRCSGQRHGTMRNVPPIARVSNEQNCWLCRNKGCRISGWAETRESIFIFVFSSFPRFMMATITRLACWAPSAMQRCWVLMSTALPARCGLNSSRMEMAQIKVSSCSFLVSMEAANPAAGEKVSGQCYNLCTAPTEKLYLEPNI